MYSTKKKKKRKEKEVIVIMIVMVVVIYPIAYRNKDKLHIGTEYINNKPTKRWSAKQSTCHVCTPPPLLETLSSPSQILVGITRKPRNYCVPTLAKHTVCLN